MKLSPERKLKFLSEYMVEWIDLWPLKPKPAIFESWVDSRLQKRINRGLHEHNQKLQTICVYCKRPFDETYVDKTKDHVIPLSKGGLDVKANRRPCCHDCNQWKRDRTPHEWIKEVQRLVKKDKEIREPYTRTMLGLIIGNLKRVINEVDENRRAVSTYKF